MSETPIYRPVGTRDAVFATLGDQRRAGEFYYVGDTYSHKCARCGVEHSMHPARPASMCRDCRRSVRNERLEVERLLSNQWPAKRRKKPAPVPRPEPRPTAADVRALLDDMARTRERFRHERRSA